MNAVSISLRERVRQLLKPARVRQPRLLTGPPSPNPRLPVSGVDPNAHFCG